jgi:hypothetical protein
MNMTEGSVTPGPHGPQVIPGVYKLKLTVDGQTYTRDVTVVNDPRVGQSPQLMVALRSQNKLNLLSLEDMKQSFAGYDEVTAVRDQLDTLVHSGLSGDLASQAKTLNASLIKVGGVMPAPGSGFGGGRRGPVDPHAFQSFFELNNSFNTMVSMVQVGLDMAPSSTQIATWQTDCDNYNHTVAAWKALQSQISDFNALLARNNLEKLTVPPTKLVAATCTFRPELSTVKPAGK